jgi:hypothetical protein
MRRALTNPILTDLERKMVLLVGLVECKETSKFDLSQSSSPSNGYH